MFKRLHTPPHPRLERFALLLFSIAVVFAALSFVPPWQGAYAETASALISFGSIYTTSVYELGTSASQVAHSELNVAAAWDAWTGYAQGVMSESN